MKNPNIHNIITHINTVVQTQSIKGSRKSNAKKYNTRGQTHGVNGAAHLKDNFGGAF
jgi:hypothetical protein